MMKNGPAHKPCLGTVLKQTGRCFEGKKGAPTIW